MPVPVERVHDPRRGSEVSDKALPWLPYWLPRREQFVLEEKTEACWQCQPSQPCLRDASPASTGRSLGHPRRGWSPENSCRPGGFGHQLADTARNTWEGR